MGIGINHTQTGDDWRWRGNIYPTDGGFFLTWTKQIGKAHKRAFKEKFLHPLFLLNYGRLLTFAFKKIKTIFFCTVNRAFKSHRNDDESIFLTTPRPHSREKMLLRKKIKKIKIWRI